jgi:hypothetical protein
VIEGLLSAESLVSAYKNLLGIFSPPEGKLLCVLMAESRAKLSEDMEV